MNQKWQLGELIRNCSPSISLTLTASCVVKILSQGACFT
jgi:hypothetical protein